MSRLGFTGLTAIVGSFCLLVGNRAAGGGVLRLHLASDSDYIRFSPPDGSGAPTTTQAIAAQGCDVALNPAATLMTLTANPAPPKGTVGLFGDALGVKVKGEGNGTPCGRVDGTSQALVLDLVRTPAAALAGKLIDFAELDIEGKFNATVRADAYLDGRAVGTATLKTGTNSDSGPDSGDGDNYRWRVDPGVPFNKLVLSVDTSTPGGSFSLEGGSDGTSPDPGGVGSALGTSDSIFQLADVTGVLDCATNPNGLPNTSGNIGGNGTPTANLTRGFNPNCVPLPYLLRPEVAAVLLQKDASTQPGANFSLDIAWDPEPTPVGPVPVTTIDYDGNGPAAAQPVQWCGGTPAAPILPPGQQWCLASQTAVLAGGGQIQISERYYGAGDPRWAR